MKRLTTDDSQSILYGLNLFFVKDGEVWIRGGGPEPDYQDCTLVDYIGRVAETHHLDIVSRDAEHLGDEMYDCLQYGTDELEGVVALLHAAAIQAAEMRGRLADIENILGDSYDLDKLRELLEAVLAVLCFSSGAFFESRDYQQRSFYFTGFRRNRHGHCRQHLDRTG